MSSEPFAPRDRRLGAAAWGALLQAHAKLVPLLDRDLRRATGLPLAWCDVLAELNAADDQRLQLSELGDQVVLSMTRIGKLVAEMEQAGLVVREPDPADKRAISVTATVKGDKLFRLAAPVYVRAIDFRFASKLTEDELEAMVRTLSRVLDDID